MFYSIKREYGVLDKNMKEALQNHYSLSEYKQIFKHVIDSRESYY